jgi:hypothetical protein
VLPALLVAVAAYADSRGSHRIAFDALLLAVPCAFVAGLSAFERFLGARDDATAGFQALAWALVVTLVTLSCAFRSAAYDGLPPIAITSVVACLAIFAVQVTVVVAPFLRRLVSLRLAKP